MTAANRVSSGHAVTPAYTAASKATGSCLAATSAVSKSRSMSDAEMCTGSTLQQRQRRALLAPARKERTVSLLHTPPATSLGYSATSTTRMINTFHNVTDKERALPPNNVRYKSPYSHHLHERTSTHLARRIMSPSHTTQHHATH